MKDNIQRPYKGLHTDSAPYDQPKESYRFALNAVNESELGDINFIGNEESNELCVSLKPGFVPLGKVYIGNNETVIFSVSSDETISEIGILKDNCTYEVHVNDANSTEEDKLNFKIANQIEAIYRLRLGCKRTIYFTDDYNRPRYYDFDSPEQFQNNNGTWNSKLFSLQKEYSSIPHFDNVEVLDSGGSLEPGNYNIAIQYVDASLNPTEWITSSPTIKIYNDLSNKEYREINGSINSDSDYVDFPKTSKAIRVEFSNLDTDFLYYRLAFIESTSGTGQITSVKYTEVIPTSRPFFIYTGQNVAEEGVQEEIALFSTVISRAKTIEQIENRILLGNTQGKQVNFCNLQKYASKIKADCITKSVVLSDITDPSNPKNPTHEFGGLGYMPGEIYSFGIIYIFKDGSLSPAYHIPGKSPSVDPNTVFSPSENTYPMSSDNQIFSVYTDNDTCGVSGYWGRDSEGITLQGKNIRHHRFPLRSEIHKPLVTSEDGEVQPLDYYQLVLNVQGTLLVPTETAPDDNNIPFTIKVTYEVDGEEFVMTETIDPNNYANGVNSTYDLNEDRPSQYHSSSNITTTTIEITDSNGVYQDATTFDNSPYFSGGDGSFSTTVDTFTSTVQGRVFTTEILGIKFSGIDMPDMEDTNGEEVIGYYIVRNERTEFDKTILDSGVLIPSVVNSNYISHGLLQPITSKLSPSVYGLIHPEHKFNNKEYFTYDEIIQQGNFKIDERKYGKITYNDVFDGSSFNSKYHKGGNDDGHDADGAPRTRGYDGWCLDIITRDNIVSFEESEDFTFTATTDIKDIFYLGALENRSINDNANDVYNITTDNQVGMINLEDGVTVPPNNNLPYVLLKKNNLEAYSNFRTLPYYKESVNPYYFEGTGIGDTAVVYGGDTYVSPMRYVNSTFWDNRVAYREGRKSFLKIVLGAVLAVVGAALLLVTGGGSTLVIGAGVALIGAGALFANSGIKLNNINKIYAEEYDKGLRETTLDDWVDAFYNYKDNAYTQAFGFTGRGNGRTGPSDDTIQWVGDCITDLWFESSMNTSLRNHFFESNAPTYLDSPGRIESGNDNPIVSWEYYGSFYTDQNAERYPVSSLERHMASKVLAFDEDRNDNRYYIGLALGEYYHVNPDYTRKNQQKIYSHLPLEYECCSECQEDFPHRIFYSEQSFQEELSDNYRIFLPNNYKDIQGESGEIMNLFKIGNNLFVHTYEGLWQMPRNYQERVTDQIVSFIGTGSYFEIPPQKVLDDDTGNTAGLQHKWSSIKTPYGYFFVCENQKRIYQFDGRQLKNISSEGMSSWFKNNIPVLTDKTYYNSTGERYPYRDNPSNIFGTGFIPAYDSDKERLLFTKKDLTYAPGIIDGEDFAICEKNGEIIQFPNYNQTIEDQEALGWTFIGVEDCRMKFQRPVITTVQEEREIITTVTVTIPNDTDIHVFLDTSGSFGSVGDACLNSIDEAVDNWVTAFGNTNPDWTGTVYKYQDSTERWVNYADTIATTTYGGNTSDKNILVISFCNEASPSYHGGSFVTPISTPTSQFNDDYDNFTNNIYPAYKSFIGIHYPIVFGTDAGSCGAGGGDLPNSREFLMHSIAALYGTELTATNISEDLSVQNPGFSTSEWNNMLSALQTSNPYPDDGLNNYGWTGKWDRAADTDGTVIDAAQFNEDINELLEASSTTEEVVETIIVDVEVETIETMYIDGVPIPDPVEYDNSWTMSYALQTAQRPSGWVSWHSYLPNFYINIPEKFYSWIHGSNGIWKHNVKGSYQTFYNNYNPHILEYVSVSNPLVTRVWNHLRLLTEAKVFDEETQEFYEERFITFNKAVLYNSRQCSGLMELMPKDIQSNQANYIGNQVINTNNNQVIIDRNEEDWTINDFRDIRINYKKPIWNSNISSVQNEYYIDKVLNTSTMDINKDWTQLESFRDKYLVIRLIFDNFANTKLLTNYSVENEQQSFR